MWNVSTRLCVRLPACTNRAHGFGVHVMQRSRPTGLRFTVGCVELSARQVVFLCGMKSARASREAQRLFPSGDLRRRLIATDPSGLLQTSRNILSLA